MNLHIFTKDILGETNTRTFVDQIAACKYIEQMEGDGDIVQVIGYTNSATGEKRFIEINK